MVYDELLIKIITYHKRQEYRNKPKTVILKVISTSVQREDKKCKTLLSREAKSKLPVQRLFFMDFIYLNIGYFQN